MPDIRAVVQRMIDAGESEENIAKVIQHAKEKPVGDSSLYESVTRTGRGAPDQGDDYSKEPTTWTGGFIKGLKQEVSGLGDTMMHLAHPGVDPQTGKQKSRLDTAGDVSGLLLPSALAMGRGGMSYSKELASRSTQALGDAAKETTSVGKAATLPVRAFQKFAGDLKRDNLGVERWKPNVSGVPDAGVAAEALPQSTASMLESPQDVLARGSSSNSGAAQARHPLSGVPYAEQTAPLAEPTGRVVGKAPTLSDELTKIVEEARGSTDAPRTSTAAPEPRPLQEGSFKQSWPKSKKQNLGGYSVGGHASESMAPVDDAVYESAASRMGVEHLPEDAGTVGAGPVPGDDVTVTPKLKLSAEEVAQKMRDYYGSRDGGRMFNPSDPKAGAEALKRMAPGPSRVPRVAQDRIDAFNMKQAADGEDDSPIVKILLAGLSGKMLAQQTPSDQQ